MKLDQSMVEETWRPTWPILTLLGDRAVAWWILGIHCHQANRHLEFTVDIICLRDICIRIPPFWSVLLDPKVLNQWSRNQVAPSTLSAWSAWGSLETDDSTCHYLVFNDVLMVIRWPTWTRCTILTWLASELSWQFLWSINPTTTVLCFHWTGTEGACWGASLACSEWLTRQLSLACNVWGNQETPWDKYEITQTNCHSARNCGIWNKHLGSGNGHSHKCYSSLGLTLENLAITSPPKSSGDAYADAKTFEEEKKAEAIRRDCSKQESFLVFIG